MASLLRNCIHFVFLLYILFLMCLTPVKYGSFLNHRTITSTSCTYEIIDGRKKGKKSLIGSTFSSVFVLILYKTFTVLFESVCRNLPENICCTVICVRANGSLTLLSDSSTHFGLPFGYNKNIFSCIRFA